MKVKQKIIFLIFIFFISCQKITFKENEITKSTVAYLNIKFHDNKKFDSIFYYMYIDENGNDLIPKYFNEQISRKNTNNDKEVIYHFLYSLRIYNSIVRDQRRELNKATLHRKDFFKNRNFKKKYTYSDSKGSISLENFDQLITYDFAGNVIYRKVNDNVILDFPQSGCRIICSGDIFDNQLFYQKFGNLFQPNSLKDFHSNLQNN
jgi:hypothetical protein